MKKLDILPLAMAEDEEYNLHLVRGDDGITKMSLYQVIMTMRLFKRDTEIHPSVSMYMVLAESPLGAISQVADVAAGGGCGSGLVAKDEGLLSGVAHQIPTYIRGWGSRTV